VAALVVAVNAAAAGALNDTTHRLDKAVVAYLRGDFVAARASWTAATGSDEPEAEYWIGAMYEKGGGEPQDFSVAAQWYRKAADGGLPAAEFRLALLLDEGKGVAVDHGAAFTLFRKAAARGHLLAMRAVGNAYQRGDGVTPDPVAALRWYRRAAEGGDDASLATARHLALAMGDDSERAWTWPSCIFSAASKRARSAICSMRAKPAIPMLWPGSAPSRRTVSAARRISARQRGTMRRPRRPAA